MTIQEVFEKYCYIDEKTEQWKIKEDAPQEAKDIFSDYMGEKPNEDGSVILY